MSKKRILKELQLINSDKLFSFTAAPKDKNIYEWLATIVGPADTPYSNGVFQLKIDFSEKYPFKPPKIRFITKIYHPNIDSTGAICLDILKNKWNPALTISKVLLSISSLLSDPNPDDSLVPYIGKQFRKNKSVYINEAKTWTIAYAN